MLFFYSVQLFMTFFFTSLGRFEEEDVENVEEWKKVEVQVRLCMMMVAVVVVVVMVDDGVT